MRVLTSRLPRNAVCVIPMLFDMLNPSFGPLLFNYMLSGVLLSRLPSPYQRDMPSV